MTEMYCICREEQTTHVPDQGTEMPAQGGEPAFRRYRCQNCGRWLGDRGPGEAYADTDEVQLGLI